MAGEKVKKKSSKPLGKGGKMPSKTSINLLIVEKNTTKNMATILIFVVFMVLVGVFVKFMVVDQLNEINRMEVRYDQEKTQLEALKESNQVYEQVRAEHSHYGNSYLNDEEMALQDRLDILRVIEDELLHQNALQSIAVSGNVAQLTINSSKLRNVSEIVASLEDRKNVEYVTVSNSVTDEVEKVVNDYDEMYQELYDALYESLNEGLDVESLSESVTEAPAVVAKPMDANKAAAVGRALTSVLGDPNGVYENVGLAQVQSQTQAGQNGVQSTQTATQTQQTATQAGEATAQGDVSGVQAAQPGETIVQTEDAGMQETQAEETADQTAPEQAEGGAIGAALAETEPPTERQTYERIGDVGDYLDPDEVIIPVGKVRVEERRAAQAGSTEETQPAQSEQTAAQDDTQPAQEPTQETAQVNADQPEEEYTGEAGGPPLPQTEAAEQQAIASTEAPVEATEPATEVPARTPSILTLDPNSPFAGLAALLEPSKGTQDAQPGMETTVEETETPEPTTVQEKVVVTTMTIYFKSATRLAEEAAQEAETATEELTEETKENATETGASEKEVA